MTREAFEKELADLRDSLISLSGSVVRAIRSSVKFLKNRDMRGAEMLVDADEEINLKCYAIEEDCLKIIATQQPVAGDLRLLFSVLQITTELERIADYAKGIARISLKLGKNPLVKPLIDIPRMTEISCTMLEDAIRAFIDDSDKAAREIPSRDVEIDMLYEQIQRELLTFFMSEPSKLEGSLMLLWVAHNLERIGDRVINICERIIFNVTGEVVDF
jgi:phosphate transport system protein